MEAVNLTSGRQKDYSAGWTLEGSEEPEYYELFTGLESEQRSRMLLIDTFTWMACDETDRKLADLYWETADYLVRFGAKKEFDKTINGIYYWRHRVALYSGPGDVHLGGTVE